MDMLSNTRRLRSSVTVLCFAFHPTSCSIDLLLDKQEVLGRKEKTALGRKISCS